MTENSCNNTDINYEKHNTYQDMRYTFSQDTLGKKCILGRFGHYIEASLLLFV